MMKNTSSQQVAARRPGPLCCLHRRQKAFTMFEVLLVVIALGLLAALVIPTVDRFFDATGDTAKTHNAQMLNQYAETLFNAGVETNWTDCTAAITALEGGVTIEPTVPGGAAQTLRLKQKVNPAAYIYAAGSATAPPTFTADLGKRKVRP